MVAINRQDRGKGLSKLWRIFFFFYWLFSPSHFCLSNRRLCDKLLCDNRISHTSICFLWWFIEKKRMYVTDISTTWEVVLNPLIVSSLLCVRTPDTTTLTCNDWIPSLNLWFPHRLFKCHSPAPILGTWIIVFKLLSCLFYQPRIWLSMVPHLRVHSALAFWLLC